MNKQELIERIEGLKNIFGNKCEYVKIDFVIELASELDEPEKVKVPQSVADWYEEHKDNLEYNIWDWMKYNLEPKKRENVIFSQWLAKTVNNPDIIDVDGCEIEMNHTRTEYGSVQHDDIEYFLDEIAEYDMQEAELIEDFVRLQSYLLMYGVGFTLKNAEEVTE